METLKFKYQHKSDTKSRYTKVEGKADILPKTLTITPEDCTPRTNAGIRNILKKVGNFVGEFRKNDVSPYKISPQRPRITGTLFEAKGIFGYSDLGFANEKNQFQRGNDLIIFHKPQNGVFEIDIFINGWSNHRTILQELAR